MTKKMACILLLLAWAWLLPAQVSPGKNLLDGLVAQFQQMKKQGSGGYEVMDKAIQDLMAAAKNARVQKKIELPFFRRYTRILQIIKLAIVTNEYDREGILNSLVQGEIDRFVADVSGVSDSALSGRGIGPVVEALSEEIINLYMTLECQGKKEELRKQLNGSGGAAKK
ncbi:MAG: hypothetical protein MUP71_12065 [Candidatus Aminicenantes bacterium]|nr:hypothetical protein [Candidatus Aminicenantes bacterium]